MKSYTAAGYRCKNFSPTWKKKLLERMRVRLLGDRFFVLFGTNDVGRPASIAWSLKRWQEAGCRALRQSYRTVRISD